MKKRDCGPCTACCEGWLTSKTLDLYPGKPCTHCTKQGCGIYETRPEDPCRNYVCGWLREDSQLPDQLRPDLSGVIVKLKEKWRGLRVINAIPVGDKIPQETLEWLMAFAQENRIPLIFTERLVKNGEYSGLKETGFGPPEFVEHVKSAILPGDYVKF